MARNTIAAIDIGTTAITTVVAGSSGKDQKFRILGIGRSPTYGMRRGSVVDIDEVTASIKKSVQGAAKAANVKISSAIIAASGTHVNSFVSRGVIAVSRADGEISEGDVKRVLAAAESAIPRNPNREVIHIIPKEYKIDSESGIADPIGMVGIRLEVEAIIIDGAKTAMQSLMKCMEGAGVEVEDFVFSPLASAEAVLSRRQKELGVMLLDIGGGTSDFSVFEEGRLIHAGVFPYGGNHITSDIAIGFQTDVDVAEKIKLSFGHSLPDEISKRDQIKLAEFVPDAKEVYSQRELAGIIEARLKDIFELAHKELKKINRAGLLPAGLVLIGRASSIPGIVELAKRELELPVEIASALQTPYHGKSDEKLFDLPVASGLILWHMNRVSGRDPFFYNSTVAQVASRVKNWLRIFLP